MVDLKSIQLPTSLPLLRVPRHPLLRGQLRIRLPLHQPLLPEISHLFLDPGLLLLIKRRERGHAEHFLQTVQHAGHILRNLWQLEFPLGARHFDANIDQRGANRLLLAQEGAVLGRNLEEKLRQTANLVLELVDFPEEVGVLLF